MSKALVVMLLLTASAPVFAQQPVPAPRNTTGFGALRRSDPYAKLFVTPTFPQPGMAAQPTRSVVCGMTMIPVEPSIDPRIERPRKSDGVQYTIRAIDPPICNPSR